MQIAVQNNNSKGFGAYALTAKTPKASNVLAKIGENNTDLLDSFGITPLNDKTVVVYTGKELKKLQKASSLVSSSNPVIKEKAQRLLWGMIENFSKSAKEVPVRTNLDVRKLIAQA